MNKVIAAILLGLALLGTGAGVPPLRAQVAGASVKYQCPMHPQIVRDEPGDCPICHMHLQKVDLDAAGDEGVPGRAPFSLSLERQQLIGVKWEPAQKRRLSRTLRLAGRVGQGGVLAQLLELDAGLAKTGQKAMLLGPDGSMLEARVSGVEDSLDSLTHSFNVTLEPAGYAAWMRGGVFCEVRLELDLGLRLCVPSEAVLDSGLRQVVFVTDGKGHFEPREVQVGLGGGGYVELSHGLKEGENVVTSANFLIDSESRYQDAVRKRP